MILIFESESCDDRVRIGCGGGYGRSYVGNVGGSGTGHRGCSCPCGEGCGDGHSGLGNGNGFGDGFVFSLIDSDAAMVEVIA